MAKHFTKEELCFSQTALSRAINNTPSPCAEAMLHRLMDELLDPVRELWGKPLTVTSGYRSPSLNKAVGGAACSQHMRGEAADITAGNPEANHKLFEMLCNSGIEFDQLIDEKGYRWLHISISEHNRRQVLHL